MLGISAFNLRQYAQAAQWLEPLKDVAGSQRSEALFWLGRSAGRAGDAARFTEYLTLVADAAPPTRRSEEALYLLAQSAADDADIARSRTYLTRLLQEYPKGAWTDVALWLQGWLAYKQREFPVAVASWGRLVAEEPGSRWRVPALYWRGRAFEALKQTAEATQAYRTLLDTAPDQPYYRLRAGERLTPLTKKAAPKPAPLASRPDAAGGAERAPRPEGAGAPRPRPRRRGGRGMERAGAEPARRAGRAGRGVRRLPRPRALRQGRLGRRARPAAAVRPGERQAADLRILAVRVSAGPPRPRRTVRRAARPRPLPGARVDPRRERASPRAPSPGPARAD